VDYSPLIKKLELPAGLTVPTQLAYGDLVASATRCGLQRPAGEAARAEA
jgi:hypothetical protein